MKTLFPGFYPYSNSEIRTFIEESTIVFGASVLLDLYRINNWSVFIDLIKNKVDTNRLWLPYDSAWLYHNRMPDVIDCQIEQVKTAFKYLNSFKESIESPFCHPYIDNILMSRFDSFIMDASKALEDDKKKLLLNLKTSTLKTEIEKLFHGKIGKPYPDATMKKLFDESEERHKSKMAPCLFLSSKTDSRIKHNRYIIWKQIQKQSIDTRQPILLVLNRITPNWFFIYNDDVIYPRQELINEFKSNTKYNIHIITAYSFVDYLTKENRTPEQESLLNQLHNRPTIGSTEKIINSTHTTSIK